MASAATLQAAPARPSLAPLAPSLPSATRQNANSSQLSQSKPAKSTSANSALTNETRHEPCDGCRTRNSRCAMNEVARKCYSCDFHRQECVFTQNTSRKRSHANSVSGTGWRVPGPSTNQSSSSSSSSSGEVARGPSTATTNSPDINSNPATVSYQYIGSTTDLEVALLRYALLDKNDETVVGISKLRKIGSDGSFVRVFEDANPNSRASRAAAEELEDIIGPFGETLLKILFSKVNPAFPILVESEFRKAHGMGRIDPALLAAIYLVSSRWLNHHHHNNNTEQKVDGTRLQQAAWKHFQTSLIRPQLSTIQAGLLLLQCAQPRSGFLSSQLVSIGFELGLHQDCSDWKLSRFEKALRKRLAWILFAQDKWSSLQHGRPSLISMTSWMIPVLCDQDFEDINGIFGQERDQSLPASHASSLSVELVTLTGILSEILDTFYTLRAESEIKAAGPHGLRMILEKAKPVQIKLKDWFSRLPSHLKMDSDAKQPLNGMLHLAYFATEITLHRCIIRGTAHDGTDSYLTYICRSAAKTRLISAMDFVNRLRPAHLRSFWPMAGTSNFALIGAFGVLLRATSPSKEEAEFYRMRLEEYRWTLAVSSNNADFLDYAISSLDTHTGLLENMPEKPEIADIMSNVRSRVYPISDPPAVSWTQPTTFSGVQRESSPGDVSPSTSSHGSSSS